MSDVRFWHKQYPVGQGGFHVGHVRLGSSRISPTFRWAYDCGSVQRTPLEREIRRVTARKSLDVLFLSHLDNDHVSGVDQLVSNTTVRQVVLPYLEDHDRVFLLAAAASARTLSGNYIGMLSDPLSWFGDRGIERIVYIDDGPDEGDDRVPDSVLPTGDGYVEGDQITGKWTKFDDVRDDGTIQGFQPGRARTRADAILVKRGGVLMLLSGTTALNWVLSPFACRPPKKKMHVFIAELEKQFGRGLRPADYAKQAETPEGQLKLRSCYDKFWKGHNLHSMALYSGPAVTSAGIKSVRHTAKYGRFVRRIVQPGWISMGDFDASVIKRRTDLLNYYAPYANFVGHIALPHHGSDLSFHEDLIAGYPKAFAAIAAVGTNGYGHPGPIVQKAVQDAGLQFVRVDENPSSRYRVQGRVR